MAEKLKTYDITFEVRFRGKRADSVANGERHRHRIKAASMEEAERHAKPALAARLKSEGMPGAFSLRWVGSSQVAKVGS